MVAGFYWLRAVVCVKAAVTLQDPESWDISGTAERLSASKQGLCSVDLVGLKISLILTVVSVTNDFLCHQIT